MSRKEQCLSNPDGTTKNGLDRNDGQVPRDQSRFKAIEQSYGTDILNMVVTRGYVAKLLANAAVLRFLQANYPDFLTEFRAIVAARSLEEGVGKA